MEPTISYKRNLNTGLIEGIEYPRLPNHRIDWKALINPTHVVFNTKNPKVAAEITTAYGAPAETLVYRDVVAKQPVADKHILILLAGFIEVAELRGYQASEVTQLQVDQGIVAVGHAIKWLPNEEEPNGKTSSGTADATLDNTGGFGYLAAMAGNRAFVRAVKNGLGIRVLGFDEIAKKDDALPEAGNATPTPIVSSGDGDPHIKTEKTARECGWTFDTIRAHSIERWVENVAAIANGSVTNPIFRTDPSTWTQISDVKKADCLTLISWMKSNYALVQLCRDLKYTFASLKTSSTKLAGIEEGKAAADPTFKRTILSDPAKWSRFEDIPYQDCTALVTRIKEKTKAAK